MKQVILADNQELTNAGWRYILKDFSDLPVLNEVHSKADLLPLIKTTTKLLVICDYSFHGCFIAYRDCVLGFYK